MHAAWHVAIPLLETHVIIFPDDTRCFHALAELYRLVDETDLLYGLWKNKCVSKQLVCFAFDLCIADDAHKRKVAYNSTVSAPDRACCTCVCSRH